MDANQPTANPAPVYTPPSSRGIFGTGMPSNVAFIIGILLFLLPLSEIKCGGTTILSKSGINFVLGKKWTPATGLGKETVGETTSKANDKKEGNAQYFAIAALGMGILGLLFSLTKSKKAIQIAMVTGVLAAGSMIAVMFEVKKWYKEGLANKALDKAKDGGDSLGLDKFGDSVNPSLTFTTWFYIAVVAFLAAAFFCYKRMQSSNTLK